MISFVEGRLEEKTPARVVVSAAGVGYEIFMPLSSYDQLPNPGDNVRILTHFHVREDAQVLYGFMSEAERSLFVRLLGVGGIGPKLALSALSGMQVRDFVAAVVNGDVKMLSSISGIGKKVAERLVVELRDKISKAEGLEAVSGEAQTVTEDTLTQDAASALMALGYKQADALKMAAAARQKAPKDAAVEDLIRVALTR